MDTFGRRRVFVACGLVMRVLVLCHGSVNRSPFAHALIQRERPVWDVRVAGLKTHAGRPATPKAKFAASKIGLDLSEHRSVPVEPEMLYWAERVLYMDGGNEKRLKALIDEHYSEEVRAALHAKTDLLARYGCLRRIRDPNYTTDPDLLAEMWAELEHCTRKFLEAHP